MEVAVLLLALALPAVAWLLLKRLSSGIGGLSILPEQFVVVELETTGLDPRRHSIIEIGAVRVNRDSNVHDTFQALVKCDKRVPKIITEMTGITEEMIEKDGVPLEEALGEFIAFAGDRRLVFFNAEFDFAFLSRAANHVGARIGNPVSCALEMSRRAWPGLRSYRLTDLAKLGGLSTRGAHRALDDCVMTVTVYGAAARKLRRLV
jgi:DNA polymerase III epsilon subunit family exonuclease